MYQFFQSTHRRHQAGTYMVWMLFLLPVLIGLFAFGTDVGLIYYERSKTQTAVDAAAMAGITVLRRVFKEPLSDISALCKAGSASQAAIASAAAAGFTTGDVQVIYCPRSSETNALITGGGPCFDIPSDAECDAGCDCGNLEDTISSQSKPWVGYFPTATDGNKAAYIYVLLNSASTGYFAPVLGVFNTADITAGAIAQAKELPISIGGAGYYQPVKAGNDPQSINLKNGSKIEIDGGIWIQDDPNNALTASGSNNRVIAEWIKVEGTNTNPNIIYECDNPCPELGVDLDSYPEEVRDYLESFEPPANFTPQNCSSSAYPDTANKCDYYPDHKVYVNCLIDSTNVASVTLYPGTYCGGLTVNGVGDDANPIQLQPITSSGVVTDDVYYFVQREKQAGDYKGTPNQPTPGTLKIDDGAVHAGNGGVADAGVYLYAPGPVAGSDYAVILENDSSLTGSILIWADHLQLEDSTLDYTPYLGGLNHFPDPPTIVVTRLVQ